MGGEEQETGKEGQAKRHGKRRAKMLANSQAKRWAKRQWYNTSCEQSSNTGNYKEVWCCNKSRGYNIVNQTGLGQVVHVQLQKHLRRGTSHHSVSDQKTHTELQP